MNVAQPGSATGPMRPGSLFGGPHVDEQIDLQSKAPTVSVTSTGDMYLVRESTTGGLVC